MCAFQLSRIWRQYSPNILLLAALAWPTLASAQGVDSWRYPECELLESAPLPDIRHSIQAQYRSDTDAETILRFYLQRFASGDWRVERLQAFRLKSSNFHNSFISGSSATEDAFVHVNLVQESGEPTWIFVTFIAEIDAFGKSRLQTISEQPERAEQSTSAGANDDESALPIEALITALNHHDTETVYARAAASFRAGCALPELETKLSDLIIEQHQILQSTRRDGLGVTAISFARTVAGKWSRRFATIYWIREDHQWRFLNLPLLPDGEQIPAQIAGALK